MRDSEALVAQAFMFSGSTGQCIAIFEKKTSNSIDLLLSFLLGFFFQCTNVYFTCVLIQH